MMRQSTRRRRRSRSASPARVSKRVKSRSRDRRGRDVVPMRGMERPVEPMRREKGGRNRDVDRRMVMRGGRDGDMDGRRMVHSSGPNSLAVPGGGGMRGGRERERDVHVRELPPVASSDYRGGGVDMRGGPVRGVTVHHMAPFNGGRVDLGRGPLPEFRGPPPEFRGDVGNGYARGGYPGPVGRSGDREREREREMQLRDREKARDRDREREKERLLLREREERARTREARAAADLRAAEALRRDTARMRDEAVLHARGSRGSRGSRGPPTGGGGGGGGGGSAAVVESPGGGERPPRLRNRERGRDRTAGRSTRGQYMTKTEVDALFTKVIKIMADDRSRFPCTASLINDRMKKESSDYNVANSEYTRFCNVLQRFETDGIVGTTKSRDSIQVVWTKYSPAGSGSTLDARRTGGRGVRDEDRSKTRSRLGGRFQLYFLAADELTGDTATATTAAVDGGGAEDATVTAGGGGADGVPYAEIIALLQGHGEVLTSVGGNDEKETLEPKATVATGDDAPEVDAAEKAVTAVGVDEGKADVQAEAEAVAAPPAAVEVLSRESTETDEDNKAGGDAVEVATADDAGPAENGGDGVAAAGQEGAEKGKEDEGGGVPPVEGKDGTDKGAPESNGKGDENGVVAVKEDKVEASARDVYAKDMAWLRSAHGLVVEASKPSFSMGYKIAMMVNQRCKPCLCLFHKGKNGDVQPTAQMSVILKGDRNLDFQEYSESSEIGEIIDNWIDKRFPRRRGDSRGRGGRGGRDRGRDGEGGSRRGSRGKSAAAEDAVKDMDASEADGVSGGRRGEGDDEEDADKHSIDDNADDGHFNAAGGGGGGGAESVVSNDEHEEVEDATGDSGNVSVDADEGQGVLEDEGGNGMAVDTAGYGSAAEESKILEDDGGDADGNGEEGAEGSDGGGDWISSEEEKISNDDA